MMLQSSSSLLLPLKPPPPLIPPPATHRRVPTPLRLRPGLVAASQLTSHGGAAEAGFRFHVHDPALDVLRPPVAAASSPGFPSSCPARNIGFRSPGLELGLLSLVFVISMVIGSFFAMVVVSLPAMGALRKLSMAMDRLSRVVSKEVPGTLLSLKLSGREINELTQQLSGLRLLGGEGGRDHRERWEERGSLLLHLPSPSSPSSSSSQGGNTPRGTLMNSSHSTGGGCGRAMRTRIGGLVSQTSTGRQQSSSPTSTRTVPPTLKGKP